MLKPFEVGERLVAVLAAHFRQGAQACANRGPLGQAKERGSRNL